MQLPPLVGSHYAVDFSRHYLLSRKLPTAATLKKVLEEEEAAAGVPLPDDGDSDLEEEEAQQSSAQQQALIALVNELKMQLVAEKKCQLDMEVRIREEVCTEMAQQLVEIENDYG